MPRRCLGGTMNAIRSTVVMPEAAPLPRCQATKGYGANVVLHGKTFDESLAKAMEIQKETGAYFVHPMMIHGHCRSRDGRA